MLTSCIRRQGGRKPLLKFKLDCISALLAASSAEAEAPDASDRFSGHHFPELIPPTANKQNLKKKCQVCTKQGRRKGSRYQCGQCVTHLDLRAAPCFKIFHTKCTGLLRQSATTFQQTFFIHIYLYVALVKVN